MRKTYGSDDYSRHSEDSADFRVKSEPRENGESLDQNVDKEKIDNYIKDCLTEKEKLSRELPIASRLIDEEIEKVQTTGRIPTRDRKYADIYREKPIRVSQKILVPVREHPKFNFVGKLLGPKGNSLRRLQEETLCRMTVLGRNSMKDRAKEEELRASKDPKYAHLNDDLHVEVSTVAPPAEAHARIAYAMAELRKYLIPDSNDVIRQEQLRELMDNPPQVEYDGRPAAPYKRTLVSGPKPSYSSPPGGPSAPRTAMAPKQKILSILDRARTAMDESYRSPSSRPHYEEPVAYEAPAYEGYSYSHAPPPSGRAPPYETQEYEAPEYRRDYYPHSPSYTPVKPGGSSSVRPSWKTNTGASPYLSRRSDDMHSGSSSSKHTRETRYKSAPYPKPK